MKINVGFFFGGRSVEHEVAVISAVQAMTNVDRQKYDITPVYITKDGEMYYSEYMTDIKEFKDIPALLKKSRAVTLVRSNGRFAVKSIDGGVFKKNISINIDIAFPVVHGTNCEDGSLVGLFELLGIPYVSCDVLSAAVGMDKAVFKYVLEKSNIPVLPGKVFYAKEWVLNKDAIVEKTEKDFSYPVIIKPANLGSSVGISIADDRDGLMRSVDDALIYAEKILIEPAITALRELNCSVVGDKDECETSVIEEPMRGDGGILSFDDKYKDGGEKGSKSSGMASLKRKIPAEIPESIKHDVEEYSKAAFKAIGACGVVRIDYLYDTDKEKVYVNEINTIPGSLSFYLWEPKGVKYKELIDRLIELGFKRERTKQNLSFSFDANLLAGGSAFGTKGKK